MESTSVDSAVSIYGDKVTVSAKIDTNGLADDLGVEMVIYSNEEGVQKFCNRYEMKEVAREGEVVKFELQHETKLAGIFNFAFRIYPKNPALAHRQSFAYLKWF